MKKHNALWLLLLALCSIFASCKKEKTETNSADQLPPATQTGANTFGCLVNGKVWVAQTNCKYLCDPYFNISYDPMFGGYLGIKADFLKSSENVNQRIEIVIDSSNFFTSRIISIQNSKTTASFSDYTLSGLCTSYKRNLDSTVIHTGNLNISRYDLQNGIVSGTFNFKLSKMGCPDLNITNGRFDKKIF